MEQKIIDWYGSSSTLSAQLELLVADGYTIQNVIPITYEGNQGYMRLSRASIIASKPK